MGRAHSQHLFATCEPNLVHIANVNWRRFLPSVAHKTLTPERRAWCTSSDLMQSVTSSPGRLFMNSIRAPVAQACSTFHANTPNLSSFAEMPSTRCAIEARSTKAMVACSLVFTIASGRAHNSRSLLHRTGKLHWKTDVIHAMPSPAFSRKKPSTAGGKGRQRIQGGGVVLAGAHHGVGRTNANVIHSLETTRSSGVSSLDLGRSSARTTGDRTCAYCKA